jgi:hypothetical protein
LGQYTTKLVPIVDPHNDIVKVVPSSIPIQVLLWHDDTHPFVTVPLRFPSLDVIMAVKAPLCIRLQEQGFDHDGELSNKWNRYGKGAMNDGFPRTIRHGRRSFYWDWCGSAGGPRKEAPQKEAQRERRNAVAMQGGQEYWSDEED